MVKTLTKHGNSYALVIDKAILQLLRIAPDSPLEISTDGRVLTIAPVKDVGRQSRFAKSLEKTNRRYTKALKRLSE